jgi:hypothetical protein
MDNYESQKSELIERHAEQIRDIIVRSSVENYTKGWAGAEKHLKDSIIKAVVNDGVISTNVDVDHLERIVRIIEETR